MKLESASNILLHRYIHIFPGDLMKGRVTYASIMFVMFETEPAKVCNTPKHNESKIKGYIKELTPQELMIMEIKSDLEVVCMEG